MSEVHSPTPKMTHRETSLPDWIEGAYKVLASYIIESDETVSSDDAAAILLEETDDELMLEPADAEHAVEYLLDRGYLYEVKNELRVTEPDPESTADA